MISTADENCHKVSTDFYRFLQISTADENCHKVETLEQYSQLVDQLRHGSSAGEWKTNIYKSL